MSRDLGRDVPGFGKTLCKKLWADFSNPNNTFQSFIFVHIASRDLMFESLGPQGRSGSESGHFQMGVIINSWFVWDLLGHLFIVPQKGVGKRGQTKGQKREKGHQKVAENEGYQKVTEKDCEWPTPFCLPPFCGTLTSAEQNCLEKILKSKTENSTKILRRAPKRLRKHSSLVQPSKIGDGPSFGEHGFKHRARWVFLPSPSSGERAQWVPLSLLFVWQSELTEFFFRRTRRACPKLSEAQWVLFLKQYSRNSILHVS